MGVTTRGGSTRRSALSLAAGDALDVLQQCADDTGARIARTSDLAAATVSTAGARDLERHRLVVIDSEYSHELCRVVRVARLTAEGRDLAGPIALELDE